jgi:hypothetical protein
MIVSLGDVESHRRRSCEQNGMEVADWIFTSTWSFNFLALAAPARY